MNEYPDDVEVTHLHDAATTLKGIVGGLRKPLPVPPATSVATGPSGSGSSDPHPADPADPTSSASTPPHSIPPPVPSTPTGGGGGASLPPSEGSSNQTPFEGDKKMVTNMRNGALAVLGALLVVLLVTSAIGEINLFYMNRRLPLENAQVELDMKRALADQAASQAKIMARQAQSKAVPVIEHVEIPTFACDTVEIMEKNFSDQRDDVNVLLPGKKYHFSGGCAWIRFGRVATLSANGYTFQEGYGRNGVYQGCGDALILTDAKFTTDDCRRFLNSHANQNVRLLVQDGGSIMIEVNQ